MPRTLNSSQTSRREFVKLAGAGASAAVLSPLLQSQPALAHSYPAPPALAPAPPGRPPALYAVPPDV